MKFTKILAVSALLAVAGAANAATSQTFGPAVTNWTNTFTLDGFDTLGGTRTLLSATILFNGEIISNFGLESLDNAPANLTANAQGEFTFSSLDIPTFGSNVVLLPAASANASVAAFDGTVDFGGTSGTSVGPVSATDNGSRVFTNAAQLLFFASNPSFTIDASATGLSNASGAGNLISLINTQGTGVVEVQYNFRTNQVPEPASLAVMGLGLAGLAAVRKRKAN